MGCLPQILVQDVLPALTASILTQVVLMGPSALKGIIPFRKSPLTPELIKALLLGALMAQYLILISKIISLHGKY